MIKSQAGTRNRESISSACMVNCSMSRPCFVCISVGKTPPPPHRLFVPIVMISAEYEADRGLVALLSPVSNDHDLLIHREQKEIDLNPSPTVNVHFQAP
jgi:hypothetical protein